MSKIFLSAILALVYQASVVKPANILLFAPVGTYSTLLSEWPLVESLSQRNHSITFLSAFKHSEAKKSKINLYNPKVLEDFVEWEEVMSFYEKRKSKKLRDLWFEIPDYGVIICERLYADPEFVEWVKSSKFDLVIIDTSGNECAFGLVHYWKAKYVFYATSTFPWYIDSYNLPSEEGIPSVSFSFTNPMSFFQRLLTAWDSLYFNFYRNRYFFPALEDITRKFLGDEITKDLPNFEEMERNASLVLYTSHYSLNYAKSLPPNFISVGGCVISQTPKPIPTDLKTFMDLSNGFIYISFGSVTDFTKFDQQVQINFINALSQFPNTKFVWKLQNTVSVTKLPDNVFVAKWMPQQSVLAHPNIIAFISHMGMGSTTETIHFSVPTICLPIMAEQDFNANNVVRHGAGIKLEIIDMKQEDLQYSINEMLTNTKYQEGMKRLTTFFKDRPAQPLETAVWWLEYILRNDNTNEYLLPPSANQQWWVRRQIDVWIFSSFLVILATTLLISLLYYILMKVFCSKKDVHSKVKSH